MTDSLALEQVHEESFSLVIGVVRGEYYLCLPGDRRNPVITNMPRFGFGAFTLLSANLYTFGNQGNIILVTPVGALLRPVCRVAMETVVQVGGRNLEFTLVTKACQCMEQHLGIAAPAVCEQHLAAFLQAKILGQDSR